MASPRPRARIEHRYEYKALTVRVMRRHQKAAALALALGLALVGMVAGARAIKDSPPSMHDGQLFTLDDTVEFFNLMLGIQLAAQEKEDLVAFLHAL